MAPKKRQCKRRSDNVAEDRSSPLPDVARAAAVTVVNDGESLSQETSSSHSVQTAELASERSVESEPDSVEAVAAPEPTRPLKRSRDGKATKPTLRAVQKEGSPSPVSSPVSPSGGGGGEVLPSISAKKKRATAASESAAPLPSAVVERVLLHHLRGALVAQHMTFTGSSVNSTEAPNDPINPAGMATEAPEADSTRSADDQGKVLSISVPTTLPCVVQFILRECARAEAMAVAKGEDPVAASVLRLSRLLAMAEQKNFAGGPAVLLFMACPACRVCGMDHGELRHLFTYLLEADYCTESEMLTMDREEMIRYLDLQNCLPQPGGSPQPPLSCCPHGEMHALLLTLFRTQWYRGRHGLSLSCHVPTALEPFVTAANAYEEQQRRYQSAVERHQHRLNQEARRQGELPTSDPVPPTNPKDIPPTPTWKAPKGRLAADWASAELAQRHPNSRGDKTTPYTTITEAQKYTEEHGGFVFDLVIRFHVGLPLHQATILHASDCCRRRVSVEILIALVQTASHITLCAGDSPGAVVCSCTPCRNSKSSQRKTFPYLEQHQDYFHAQNSHKLNSQLIPPGPGDVAGDAFNSFYSAGTHSHYFNMEVLASPLRLTEIVEAAARMSVGEVEVEDPTTLTPPSLRHVTLKRHQLENVQWMMNREENGVEECVEIPLWGTDASSGRNPIRVGTFFYSAAGYLQVVLPRETPETALAYNLMRRRVSGGFLCDDVGLGKTLSLLTLCMNDRGSEATGATSPPSPSSPSRVEATSPSATTRKKKPTAVSPVTATLPMTEVSTVWEIKLRRPTSTTAPLKPTSAFLKWAFGFTNFRRHGAVPLLPRTTLIVVPLSIVGQWIEEIRRFYPHARYIMYHGPKRLLYTAEDLAQADFIVTSYETVSAHLRRADNGVGCLLGEQADQADDEACCEAVMDRKGKETVSPVELFQAVKRYAKEKLWPTLSTAASAAPRTGPKLKVQCTVTITSSEDRAPSSRGSSAAASPPSRRSPPRRGKKAAAAAAAAAAATEEEEEESKPSGKWSVSESTSGPGAVFTCPELDVRAAVMVPAATPGAEGGPQHDVIVPSSSTLPPAFLDAVWKLVMDFLEVTTHPQVVTNRATAHRNERRPVSFWGTRFRTALGEDAFARVQRCLHQYSMDARTRREMTRQVWLPVMWAEMEAYWPLMDPHYEELQAQRESITAGGVVAANITEVCFRRVVFDEAQKIGPTSLFHLLRGTRRWVVSGTPINNNRASTMAAPLRCIGALAAYTVLNHPESSTFAYQTPHTFDQHANVFVARSARLNVVNSRRARRYLPALPSQNYGVIGAAVLPDNYNLTCCLCVRCCAHTLYGFPHPDVQRDTPFDHRVIPSELQPTVSQAATEANFNCMPGILLETLRRFMIRHERSEELRREFALEPVEHVAVPVALSADEKYFYERVAVVLSGLSARLHRQGLLTSRMGRVLLWIQDLIRLCLHPTLANSGYLVHGLAEFVARSMPLASRLTYDPGECTATVDEMRATFTKVSPAEALQWAKEERQRLLGHVGNRGGGGGGGGPSVFPEDTMEALTKLAEVPPQLPNCGVCLDYMQQPTLLVCYHLFCQECILGIVESGLSMGGVRTVKCPYCRTKITKEDRKRVIDTTSEDAEGKLELIREEQSQSQSQLVESQADTDPEAAAAAVQERLARIGDGSRVATVLRLLREIWAAHPDDGVLVFSTYPAMLHRLRDAVEASGLAQPQLIDGAVTLTRRLRVFQALQPPPPPPPSEPGAPPASVAAEAVPPPRRLLMVTSRSANAGLHLTFANHVVFVEPTINPAVQLQAIGRVNRIGQTKHVKVYHLFATNTIEHLLYERNNRILRRVAEQGGDGGAAAPLDGSTANAAQRVQAAQLGNVQAVEAGLLLQYPPPVGQIS